MAAMSAADPPTTAPMMIRVLPESGVGDGPGEAVGVTAPGASVGDMVVVGEVVGVAVAAASGPEHAASWVPLNPTGPIVGNGKQAGIGATRGEPWQELLPKYVSITGEFPWQVIFVLSSSDGSVEALVHVIVGPVR